MSLMTLLEAAQFLERQEQELRHRETVEAALGTLKNISTVMPATVTPTQVTPQTITITSGKQIAPKGATQTVVLSSSNVISAPINVSTPIIKKELAAAPLPQSRHRVLHNSFDIMNPLIIDEASGETKRKQPPLVFRSGTREVHNKLEKCRRAHLKECFDLLKKQLPPPQDDKKTSNLTILHSALRHIQQLRRKERDLEHEMERLAREKIAAQQRLVALKKEISTHYDIVDFSKILPEVITASPSATCTNNIAVADTLSNASEELLKDVRENSNNDVSSLPVSTNSTISNSDLVQESMESTNKSDQLNIPILAKASIPIVNQTITPVKDINNQIAQPMQTTALSVLPMTYSNMNQGMVLQKVALVPTKGLTELAPLVSTHFISQQINGKVVPLTQYLVKPVVVVSTASPRPS